MGAGVDTAVQKGHFFGPSRKCCLRRFSVRSGHRLRKANWVMRFLRAADKTDIAAE
jgi:hypothetical protein